MPTLSAAVFLRRSRTRLLPSVYSRTRVSSHPRYSASIDNRVDALILVKSGGSRRGIHSYSSDRSLSQPSGIRPRCIAVTVVASSRERSSVARARVRDHLHTRSRARHHIQGARCFVEGQGVGLLHGSITHLLDGDAGGQIV